ncbi:FG-GAP repeat domain-containing protein [Methylomonas sp. HYX-M1]|uniref:FG-GAP repeat domain-containing protein n=1 Tax=Methylomonas sp. HYX-M1 TaxID=3139307 RepID=UPI00345B9BA7
MLVATVGGKPHRFAVTNALGPIDLIFTDVNGDGISDAASANEPTNNISIYFGKGDGSFDASTAVPTGIRPQRIQAGDFNRDGHIDLVTANLGDPFAGVGDVSLLLGDGSGGFAAPQSVSIGKLPFDVAVADFNRDDKPDLAVADYDYETQTIALRLGNGDGSFQPIQTFPVPELAQSLAATDLNGDQNPDLVSNGAVLLGDGAGGFLPASRFPLGAPPYLVRVGDLNADSKPDVVLASGGSNNVSVLLNQGDGSLAPPRYYQTGNNPAEVSIVDLDGDDKTDLLVSNSYDDHLSLLYGKGDGYFSGLPAYPTTDGTGYILGALDSVAADFSGDGIADLLVANHSQQAALLLGLGQGRFDSPTLLPRPIDGVKVVSGDWNGDGKRDAAFLNSGSYPNLLISLGQGDGSFTDAETIALPEPNYSANQFLTSARLNNDSYPDLIATDPTHNSLSLLLGNGAGSFTLQPALAVGVVPVAVASADFNGDGKPDLAIAHYGDNESAPNGSLQLALGNGDGSFQAAQIVRADVIAKSLATADFNLDGKLDLAAIIGSNNQDDIEFFAGQGNGGFAGSQALGLNLGSLAGLQAADADRDGKPDLGFSISSSSRAAGLRGNGDGSFTFSGFISLGSYGDAKLAQLNDDTEPDLIVSTGIGFIAACLSQDCPLTAPSDDSGSLDPFLCWQASPAKAARGTGPYPKFSPVNALPVADALGVAEVEQARKMNLRKPAQLCNPVAIGSNDTQTASHPAHLTEYLNQPTKTKPAQSKFQPKTVAISNQLGELSLNLSAPASLLSPGAKAAGDGGATALNDTRLTHFQCYKAKVAKAKPGQAALAKFTPTELLLQDDQAGPLRFKLAPPSKLCAPAALDDSSASAFGKTDLLTCYPVRLAKTKPAQTRPNSQISSVNDRFGAQVLISKTAKALCLPSQLQ